MAAWIRRERLPLLALLAAAAAHPSLGAPRPALEVQPDWRFVAGGSIRYPPAISGEGMIYCLSDDRKLRCISPQGREVWNVSLRARPAAAPVVAGDGSILVVGSDGLLVSFGPQGAQRWTRGLGSAPVQAPAAGEDGSLYLPLGSGYLLSVDYRGRDRWTFRFKAGIAAPPSLGRDGTLYVCTEDRLLHAIAPAGIEGWTASLPANGSGVALGSRGTVYVSAFGIHALSPGGRLLWEFPLPEPVTASAVGADPSGRSHELVVVGARNGFLHIVDAEGRRVEEIELGGSIVAPPALRPDGSVVVSSSSGVFHIRPGAPDERAAFVLLKAPASPPVLAPSGLALCGSEDWVLYACSFADETKAAARPNPDLFWPQPRHDARQTGRASREGSGAGSAALVLRELAASPLLSLKEQVLDAIRGHLAGEAFLPLEAAQLEYLLLLLAREGVLTALDAAGGDRAGFPLVRVAACELLGELGTEGARVALIGVVETDPRSEVQSSAAEALGRIGYDPDGRSSRAVSRLAERRPSDERLLLTAVGALQGIAARGGPALGLGDASHAPVDEGSLASRPAWEALVRLAAGPFPQRIREAAWDALAALEGEIRR